MTLQFHRDRSRGTVGDDGPPLPFGYLGRPSIHQRTLVLDLHGRLFSDPGTVTGVRNGSHFSELGGVCSVVTAASRYGLRRSVDHSVRRSALAAPDGDLGSTHLPMVLYSPPFPLRAAFSQSLPVFLFLSSLPFLSSVFSLRSRGTGSAPRPPKPAACGDTSI